MVAADAGPMGIEWIGGAVRRWAGSARRSTADDIGSGTVVGEASLLTLDDREKREGEIVAREDAEVLQVPRHPKHS